MPTIRTPNTSIIKRNTVNDPEGFGNKSGPANTAGSRGGGVRAKVPSDSAKIKVKSNFKRTRTFLHGSSNPNIKVGDTLKSIRFKRGGASATSKMKVAKKYAKTRDPLGKGTPTVYKLKVKPGGTVTKRTGARSDLHEYNSYDFVVVGKKPVR